MINPYRPLFALLLVISTTQAHADLDRDQTQGLKDTKHLLVTPSERDAFIKKDKSAADVDQKLESLTGKGGKDEVYGLSAQIMEKITTETNGDPVKMQTLLMDAQKNPEAFYRKYFNAGERAQVESIAHKSENRTPSTSPAH